MAKVAIIGEAMVVTSTAKLEDIKMISKYRPEALLLKGGEDKKEVIFAVGVGANSININGALFQNESRDGQKLACITVPVECGAGEDVKAWVADKYGAALKHLAKLEATFEATVEDIKKDRESIMNGITLA